MRVNRAVSRPFVLAAGIFLSALPAAGEETSIAEVQGPDHNTPLLGGGPVTVSGIVTGRFGKGFFLQSAEPDDDPKTAEGVFVFLPEPESFTTFEVGSVVTVTGKPTEFQPFAEFPIMPKREIIECGTTNVTEVPSDDRKTFRPITEITNVTALTIDGTAELPEPVALAPPGATSDIAFADRPDTPFNPAEHPRDYFESLEHMRVVIPDAVVVSRKEKSWDAFWVASAAHLAPGELTDGDLPLEIHGHVFPEVVQVHKAFGQPALALAPKTRLGDLSGIMTYENGNYMVVLDEKIDPASVVQPEPPQPSAALEGEGIRIATYNAQNLSVGTSLPAKFEAIARQITGPLGSPDIIALQEIQDDDGPEITEIVSAAQTLAKLTAAIEAAGGPAYTAVSLDPSAPNTDGGAPGANIRTAFLVRADSGITLSNPERLFDGEDRCADTNPFVFTRRPVLVEADTADGRVVFLNLHLSSKIGDEGPYTLPEDPKAVTSPRRRAQAEAIVAELERRYDPSVPIILLGDFNDHADADTLAPFLGSVLGFRFTGDRRGPKFTYSHEFSGLRGAIDHVVASGAIPQGDLEVLYLNLNADVLDRASDHNPVIAIIR